MCGIQRFYIFLTENDWKRHSNSLALWIMTKHFACVFLGEKKSIYECGEDVFVFKVSTIHKFTLDRCHKPAQHCDRRRASAERNYTRCKYEHIKVQIPRSFIPKLVLYISIPFSKFHSQPYARSVHR